MIEDIEDVLYEQARRKHSEEWVDILKKHGVVREVEKGMLKFSEEHVKDVKECMSTTVPEVCLALKHPNLTKDLVELEDKVEAEFKRLKAEWLRTSELGM